MDRLPHISAAFRPAVRRPATITFRRNAAATDSAPRLARVGPPATAQPSYLCARTCRFFALCRNITGKRTGWPMRDNGGFERRLQVFVDAIDRRGKRNDKIGMELHIRTDLGSRERLNGCIDFLHTAEWAPGDVARVTSELFGSDIRVYAFTDNIHEREARYHSFELDEIYHSNVVVT
ncbi:hypothetical protein BU17DRAFT_72283 [Hysterangium stoloniferum]|nr:hypothetical protein BU17DRAFT_72283 [Hysterangium stoloniferum]